MTWRCTCQHLPAPTEATSPANGNRQRGATRDMFQSVRHYLCWFTCDFKPIRRALRMAIFSLLCIQAHDW